MNITIEQLKDNLKSLKIMGDSQEAREAFWWLRDNYARSARLAVALDAHLQQEREGREKLAEALKWYGETSIYVDEIEGRIVAMIDRGELARAALARTEA